MEPHATERKETTMSIPTWQKEAAAAVPTSVVRQLVADFSVSPQSRGRSPIVREAVEARPAQAARVVPLPKDPPGYDVITKLLDHQDEIDRQDRILAAARRLMEMKGMVRR
jgi:hypothetical protein